MTDPQLGIVSPDIEEEIHLSFWHICEIVFENT